VSINSAIVWREQVTFWWNDIFFYQRVGFLFM